MSHFFGQLSLLHGWFPIAVQAITLLVAVAAIGLRRRRWRSWTLPVALGVAGAATALSYWYITSLGVAGDPAPVVVGEEVGTDVLADVEVLGQRVGDVLVRARLVVARPLGRRLLGLRHGRRR